MDFDVALKQFWQLHQQLGGALDAFLLIFARVLAYTTQAPVFSRKDIVFNVRLALALFLSVALLWAVPLEYPEPVVLQGNRLGWFLLQLGTNVTVGLIIGFVGNTIMMAVNSAGAVMNNQIGLSSAMMMDPSSRRQTMLLDPLFGFIATVIFINIGGMYWLVEALRRTFEVFPLYAVNPHLPEKLDLEYLVQLSANTIIMGVQLVAPIFLVTLVVDIMLGVVNRTAQQIPVFQISFAVKPAVGISILLLTLPILLNAIENFLRDFSQIF
ncbi:MAG: flagellar biosynthetic protein FliR [Candidatus Melainabacteria bacterium]|nr:flagellar biosynthetic protein FliR [Candidatus Melainabacteria bacterium]